MKGKRGSRGRHAHPHRAAHESWPGLLSGRDWAAAATTLHLHQVPVPRGHLDGMQVNGEGRGETDDLESRKGRKHENDQIKVPRMPQLAESHDALVEQRV